MSGTVTRHEYGHAAQTTPTLLLVWDAPNLDMGLGSILGARPTAAHRPRFDAIGRWLVRRALTAPDGPVEPEATVFTNINPGGADIVRPWVEALRNVGFAVFAKPKIDDDSDVDPDMLDHIRRRRDEGVLRGVVVASADGQNFQPLLEELADAGLPVTVLGFREHASWAVNHERLEFVDLEDIEGVFPKPLPRVDLEQLPDDGAWLQPFRPLTNLLEDRPERGDRGDRVDRADRAERAERTERGDRADRADRPERGDRGGRGGRG